MSVPTLPSISTKATPKEVKQSLDRIRIFFEELRLEGWSGKLSGDAISDVTDVVDSGSSPEDDGDDDGITPSTVSGLTATGAFNSILLSFDTPTYDGHSHTEIHRAATDNIGVAVYIGSTRASVYSDTPPDSSLSTTYYYWVRNVSTGGSDGPFNSSSGTSANTADEPEYLLELLLASRWLPSLSRALDFLGYPSKPNGYAYIVTVAGTSGTTEPDWPTTLTETVSDGTITWRCEAEIPLTPPFILGLVDGVIATVIRSIFIGDATITNAKIASLAADKITAGYLAAARIEAGSLNANKITTRTLTADRIVTNALTANEIAANTITASEIAANAITATEVNASAITTEKINDNAVTVMVGSDASSTSSNIVRESVTTMLTAPNVTVSSSAKVLVTCWADILLDELQDWGELYLYRGSTLLRTWVVYPEDPDTRPISFSSPFPDSPGSGTYSYTLRALAEDNNGFYLENYGISVITMSK